MWGKANTHDISNVSQGFSPTVCIGLGSHELQPSLSIMQHRKIDTYLSCSIVYTYHVVCSFGECRLEWLAMAIDESERQAFQQDGFLLVELRQHVNASAEGHTYS